MKILFFGCLGFEKAIYNQQNLAYEHELKFIDDPLSHANLAECTGFDAVSIFVNNLVHEDLIEGLSKLKVAAVLLRSTGFEHVNLKAAKKHKITVMNVRDYSPESVAEHALLLTLALLRKLIVVEQNVENYDFSLTQLMGNMLGNKTIGIIGLGKIGSAFAKICNGFGCKLLGFDPYAKVEQDLNVQMVTLDRLYSQSDIISLHCPLNESNFYMIGEDELAMMKEDAIIINTARGGLIDTQALLDSLNNRKIAAAGLDVYEFENNLYFKKHSPYLGDDSLFKQLLEKTNVLITPHTGFYTKEAVTNIANKLLMNAQEFESNGSSANAL